ncbi:hypothetical protein CO669_21940 [Bradyrhizobium sp. Y36]|uniref:phosphotransferase family protein n=1 Tax=Bradyrhizobium sp. Y36 TaxID=2035447 RepID=UPI000BE7AD7E|nr:aminoglycoside phosphotransferase family protein [Bradyrhizobium sp. Y36]PDT88284.1 hypothetical protein CO669_21940 [Bradyrhizobium sp. Y36]
MFLTASNVFHYLRDVGQLSSHDIVEENFRVVEIGRRNRNFRILRNSGPSLFVKQIPIVHPETIVSFRREAAVAQIASEAAPESALKKVPPTLRRYDPRVHVLVYDALDPAETLSDLVRKAQCVPTTVARRWGRTLAACHIETARPGSLLRVAAVLSGDPPWVLSMGQKAEMVMPNMNGGRRQVVDVIRSLPELYGGLAELNARWRRICLMHGDMKWDNVLLVGESGEDRELRIIDWELADLGDPLWDVASALCTFVQLWLLNLPLQQMPGDPQWILSQATSQIAAVKPPALEFWNGYCEVARIAIPIDQSELALSGRLVGARLVLLAFELLSADAAAITPHAAAALQMARYFLADPLRACGDLFGITAQSIRAPAGSMMNEGWLS